MINFSMRQLTGCVAVAAAVSLCVPASQAVVVNITAGVGGGTTVFDSGGFESPAYTVGATPVASNPAIGTWILGSAASDGVKTKTGASTTNLSGAAEAGPAGAFGGANYLTLDRSNGGSANSYIAGSFSQDIALADSSFEIDFAFWVADGGYHFFGVGSDAMGRVGTTYDESIMQLAFDARNDPEVLNPLGNSVASVGSYGLSEWVEVKYTWNHLTQENIMSINGTDYTIAAPTTSVNTTVGEFVFGPGISSPAFFVDVVPEPGSMALISLGGLIMLRRKRSA